MSVFLPLLLPLLRLAVVRARTRRSAAVASLAVLVLSGSALGGPPRDQGQPRETSSEVARPRWQFECACGTEAEFVGRLWDEHGVEPAAARLEAIRILPTSQGFELTIQRVGEAPRSLADGSCRTLFDTALVILATAAGLEAASPTAQSSAESSATRGSGESEAGANSSSGVGAELQPGRNVSPTSPPSAAPPAERAPQDPESSAGKKADASKAQPKSAEPQGGRHDPSTRRPAAASPKPSWRLRPLASVGAGGEVGLHPNLAAFGELELGLTLRDWGLSASARYAPPTTDRTLEDMGLTMSSVQLRLAALYFVRSWLRAAVGPTVTRLDGTGRGIARPEAASIWLLASELEISVSPVRSGAWSVETGLRGSVALNAPRFELDGGMEIYRLPRAGAAIFLRGSFRPR